MFIFSHQVPPNSNAIRQPACLKHEMAAWSQFKDKRFVSIHS